MSLFLDARSGEAQHQKSCQRKKWDERVKHNSRSRAQIADRTSIGLLSVPFAIRDKPSASLLPFQQIELFDIDAVFGAVQGDDDGQPDRDFGRRYGQGKKYEHLSAHVL